ncbi:MAG: bifunctional glutamate N-acetyltransferase/amino-acid acetyltransferase ArgJ [Nitriliruptorales bacterium]|nr:bifunctional glutamate N-acetyltransferase/amino-acid acetyltransferase ArgJ [Nitriliruptorales bacterium]
MTHLSGGVTATPGVTAAGIAAGLKPSGAPDMALVAAPEVVNAAAVQTRNQVTAAPVQVTARHVADGRARAVLLNAGSANVCTGPDGVATAERSAELVAEALECRAQDVLLCSTGIIGVAIPSEPFLGAIPRLVAQLGPEGGSHAAKAIMTTDTRPKDAAVRVADGSGACVVGGMAKGSGMIAPEMATMLCVLTTDAPVRGPVLRATLKDAVTQTFGRISVDDCMSTNDAVIILATGTAESPPSLSAFSEGLTAVCAQLAEQLVRDGEGAAKLVRIRVTGARAERDAVGVGRAIASSALVRTAVAGEDPNWGRVMAAMGAGAVRFDPNRVAISFGGVTVCRFGVAAAFDRGLAAAALRRRDVTITVDLGLGAEEATFLTCDLTHDYVTINAEYTT